MKKQTRARTKKEKIVEEVLSRIHVPRYEMGIKDQKDGREERHALVDLVFMVNGRDRAFVEKLQAVQSVLNTLHPQPVSFEIIVGVRLK